MSECLTLEDETLKDKENLIDQINQLLIYEEARFIEKLSSMFESKYLKTFKESFKESDPNLRLDAALAAFLHYFDFYSKAKALLQNKSDKKIKKISFSVAETLETFINTSNSNTVFTEYNLFVKLQKKGSEKQKYTHLKKDEGEKISNMLKKFLIADDILGFEDELQKELQVEYYELIYKKILEVEKKIQIIEKGLGDKKEKNEKNKDLNYIFLYKKFIQIQQILLQLLSKLYQPFDSKIPISNILLTYIDQESNEFSNYTQLKLLIEKKLQILGSIVQQLQQLQFNEKNQISQDLEAKKTDLIVQQLQHFKEKDYKDKNEKDQKDIIKKDIKENILFVDFINPTFYEIENLYIRVNKLITTEKQQPVTKKINQNLEDQNNNQQKQNKDESSEKIDLDSLGLKMILLSLELILNYLRLYLKLLQSKKQETNEIQEIPLNDGINSQFKKLSQLSQKKFQNFVNPY